MRNAPVIRTGAFFIFIQYHKNAKISRLVGFLPIRYNGPPKKGESKMEQKNLLEQISQQNLMVQILHTNSYSEKFGLTLSDKEAELLAAERGEALRRERRVEFGPGILPRIIYAFCDSAYINREDYCNTLVRLQEIFYLYKNEMMDEITDEELLAFMKEQFEEVCFGDLDYLESTCLELFAQAIRRGYRGYVTTAGQGELEKVDIVKRWDRELYLEALRELCWR